MTANDLKLRIMKRFGEPIYRDALKNLADNNQHINDDREAFNFDEIKNVLFKHEKFKSADALVVENRDVCLIEFKTGFSKTISSLPCIKEIRKAHQEEMKLSIRLKACESLILLEKILCDGEPINFRKIYMTVIDSDDDPLGARSDSIGGLSGNNESFSMKNDLRKVLSNSLLLYRKEVGGKEHVVYDDVKVVYDSQFDAEMMHIK